MRAPLHPPTETLSHEQLAGARAYLDGQEPIELACWVTHEQQGVSGPLFDHHLMLGVPDSLYADTDIAALDLGLGREAPFFGWVDIFPLSEVEAIRGISFIVWERGDSAPVEGLDPLAFHISRQPIDPPSGFVESVRRAVEDVPALTRVDVSRQRLWKDDREIWSSLSAFVTVEGRRGVIDETKALQAVLSEVFSADWSLTYGPPSPSIPATNVFDRLAGTRA